MCDFKRGSNRASHKASGRQGPGDVQVGGKLSAGRQPVFELFESRVLLSGPGTPLNVSPADGSTAMNLTPTLTASEFIAPAGDTQLAAEWVIKSGPTTVVDTGADTTDLTSYSLPGGALAYATGYTWQVRYEDIDGLWSGYSTATGFGTMAGPPNVPVNGTPADGATTATLTPALAASAFGGSQGDTQSAAEWVITSGGTTVWDSGTDTTDLTSVTVPSGVLGYATQYAWSVNYQGAGGLWSGYSTATGFTTTLAVPPNTPVNDTPADGATAVTLTPTLTAGTFSDPDGDTQSAAEWVIKSGSTTVLDSGADTADLTSYTVLPLTLAPSTAYTWQVRYQDGADLWSDYSTPTAFTTEANLPPDVPTNVSPAGNATGASLTPTLTAGAFSDPLGNTQTAAEWVIMSGGSVWWDSGTDTTDLTSVTVPSDELAYGARYTWKVQYENAAGLWSGYSTATSFTTICAPPSIVIPSWSGSLMYTVNSSATPVASALALGSGGNTALVGATVTISGNYVSGQDVLGFSNQNGITGSWNSATGVMTLSGTSSVANYQAALASVTYVDTSFTPSTLTRTVSFVADDGAADNHLSNTASRSIVVTRFYIDISGAFGTNYTLPSSIVSGKAFSGYASVNVQNVGTLPLPYTQRVTVTLIAQNTATNVETTLGFTTVSVSGLNPTYSVMASVYGTTKGLATGSYTILATLTPVQALNEINTANNNVTTPAKAITVAPPYVDLAGVFGTNYTLPTSVVSGAAIKGTVAVNVQNLGNAALPSGQTVTVTLIAKNTDTSDETTLGSATANVAALPASGSRSTSIAVNSAGLATGNYTILARLTPVQALNETSTANNDVTTPGHAITAAPAYADLTGTFGTTWTLPSNVVGGKTLVGTTSVVVKNNGNVALPTGQKVNIVLVAHDIATSVDTTLATLSNQLVSALAAGGTKQFTASVSRAAGLSADSYEIEATITPVQALAESDTNNNTATTPAHTVTSTAPFVDLSGVFGTTWTLPTTIANGKSLLGYASVVVKNGGNVALPTGQNVNIVVIAHDTTNTNNPDITLVTLTNQSVSALAAGGTKQFNAYVTRPAGLPADHYQVEATITPVQALTESNLSNNTVLLNALGNTLGITVS